MRITLRFTTGFLWWKKIVYKTFQGDGGTVWHDVTNGERPGTAIESQLAAIAWFRSQPETDPEACPGCGCVPGDGVTATCFHPDGCGYFKDEVGLRKVEHADGKLPETGEGRY